MRHVVLALGLLVLAGCSSTTSTDHSPPTTPSPTVSSSAHPPPSGSPTTKATPDRLVMRTLPWRLPLAIAREAAIRRGSRVVLAGGLLPGDQSTDRAESLDLRTGRSTPLPMLPVPVHDTAGAFVGGRFLVVGGGNSSEQAVVQASASIGQPWSVAGRLPQPRSDLSVVRLGSKVLVLGGYDATSVAVGAIVSSPDASHWRTVGSEPVPVRYAATAVDHHAAYLFGGERAGVMQRAVQRVTADGRASVVARLPVALGHASAVRLGDRILVVGGRLTTDRLTDRMWWFDPKTASFTRAGHLPTPLADSAVVLSRGAAYLLGGETPSETDRVVRLSLG